MQSFINVSRFINMSKMYVSFLSTICNTKAEKQPFPRRMTKKDVFRHVISLNNIPPTQGKELKIASDEDNDENSIPLQ